MHMAKKKLKERREKEKALKEQQGLFKIEITVPEILPGLFEEIGFVLYIKKGRITYRFPVSFYILFSPQLLFYGNRTLYLEPQAPNLTFVFYLTQ